MDWAIYEKKEAILVEMANENYSIESIAEKTETKQKHRTVIKSN